LAVAIKECEAFQQPTKCGGIKTHKGRKPDCVFMEPRGGEQPLERISFVMRSWMHYTFITSNILILCSLAKLLSKIHFIFISSISLVLIALINVSDLFFM